MTQQTRSVLYSYFETGDRPTQSQFADLIDSSLNIATTSAQYITSDISAGGTVDVSGNLTVLNSALTNLTGNLTVAGAANFYTAIATQNAVSAIFNGPTLFNSTILVANSAQSSFTGNVVVSGLIIPPGGIRGKSDGTNAAVGNVGRVVKSSALSGTISLISNTAKTIASIPVLAGDWDIEGTIGFLPDATTTIANLLGGISVSADTFPSGFQGTFVTTNFVSAGGGLTVYSTPVTRVNITTSTNYYLIAQTGFSISTMTAGGLITARRAQPG